MARLPNAESAILDLRKLSDYCLDSAHPRGRNKITPALPAPQQQLIP